MSDPKEVVKKRTLDISDKKGAEKNIKDLVKFGNVDAWQLLCKASSNEEGFSKSTKVMNIENEGCLVQVSTMQENSDGSYAVAEALCFIPKVLIKVEDKDNRKLEGIY